MKSLLKLGFFLVVGVLAYNYFFGTVEEKQQSKEIVQKVGDVGRDAWGLLKNESAKLKEGKYDGAVDKVSTAVKGLGELLGKLSKTAKDLNDSGALDQISNLQQKQEELQTKIQEQDTSGESGEKSESVKDLELELKKLAEQTEILIEAMNKE